MATKKAKQAVNKTGKKKSTPVLTEKGFKEKSGSDPRNGIVTLKKFGNGFLLTNTRTGLEEKINAFTKAADRYNDEINNSHRQ